MNGIPVMLRTIVPRSGEAPSIGSILDEKIYPDLSTRRRPASKTTM